MQYQQKRVSCHFILTVDKACLHGQTIARDIRLLIVRPVLESCGDIKGCTSVVVSIKPERKNVRFDRDLPFPFEFNHYAIVPLKNNDMQKSIPKMYVLGF